MRSQGQPLSRRDILVLALLLVSAVGVVAYRFLDRPQWDRYEPAKLVGMPSVVSFSTGTCPACLEQNAVLARLRREVAGRARLLSVDVTADRPEIRQAIEEFDIQFVPTIVFFDAEGRPVDIHVGYLSAERLRERLRGLGVTVRAP